MRILYLCADLGIPVLGGKGAAVHVRAITTALARGGHEVAVAAPALVREPWERPVSFELPVLHAPPAETVEAASRGVKAFREAIESDTPVGGELRRILYNEQLRVELKRTLERTPPDVIVERASLFGTAGSLVATELGVPHVLELNAPLAAEQGVYRRGTLDELASTGERWLLRRADAVFAVSSPLAEHAVRSGAARERVHVLPNGVDPTTFHPGPRDSTLRRRLGLGAGPVVGFVGGLRPWHGIELLPRLLERLAARRPDVTLAVVGDGPLAGVLRDGLGARGLADRAVLLGSVPHDEVAAVVRELDLALAPYPEPAHEFYFSPLKLFEYMGCGVPVVASRIGQIAEIVRDGENGLLTAPGDLDELVGACERLLDDGELARRLGARAADDVAGRYTWDANAARIGALAERLRAARAVAA